VSTLAVYDCMLFFRETSRPGRVRSIFDVVRRGSVTLCLSPDVLAEIRDVLTRPKLVVKYPALTPEAVDAFLAEQLRSARWLNDVPERFVLARDPKDSKYLNLAIAAAAPYIVTADLDMLDLMHSEDTEAKNFRSLYPGVSVHSPGDFEAIIARTPS